jgi:chromosome segregation ATPase
MVLSRCGRSGRIAAVIGIAVLVCGCDMGLEQSSNRYEQLNIETKKLTEVLNKITDEKSAKEHQSELEEAGERIRDIQKRIAESEERKAKKGGGGMGGITNFRQASLFEQTGDAARRQVERIREADEKAGAIVDSALTGIQFPEPPPEAVF